MITIQYEFSFNKRVNISRLQLNDFYCFVAKKQNNETFDLIGSFRYFDLMSSCHLLVVYLSNYTKEYVQKHVYCCIQF